jgi:hypothetical protein
MKEPIELELIKIKVIKRRHIEQLIEPVPSGSGEDEPIDEESFIAYVKGQDAILCRDKITGRLSAYRVIQYLAQVMNKAAKGEYIEARRAAYARVHALPQILVD